MRFKIAVLLPLLLVQLTNAQTIVEPKPGVSGVLTIGAPELVVRAHSEPPRRSSPASLANVASERYPAVTRFSKFFEPTSSSV